jgi:hypothetical protein
LNPTLFTGLLFISDGNNNRGDYSDRSNEKQEATTFHNIFSLVLKTISWDNMSDEGLWEVKNMLNRCSFLCEGFL